MYLVSLKRPCGSLKVIVQQTWLGDVRSVTPSTSETGTTGELLHRSPELSPLVYYVLEYLWVVYVTLWLCDSLNVCCNAVQVDVRDGPDGQFATLKIEIEINPSVSPDPHSPL